MRSVKTENEKENVVVVHLNGSFSLRVLNRDCRFLFFRVSIVRLFSTDRRVLLVVILGFVRGHEITRLATERGGRL